MSGNKESNMPLTANKLFMVNISNDKLTATLSLHTAELPEKTSSEEILSQISGMKIIMDDNGKKTVENFIAKLDRGEIPKPVIITQGCESKPDKPGTVETLFGNPAKLAVSVQPIS